MAAFDSGEFDSDEPLLKMLQRFVEERVQLKLPLESFRPENLKPHFFMNFRVIDEHGRVMGQSRNLMELRARFREQVAARFSTAKIGGALAGALSVAGAVPGAAEGERASADKAGRRASDAVRGGSPSAAHRRDGATAGDAPSSGKGPSGKSAVGKEGDAVESSAVREVPGPSRSGFTTWSFGSLP